MSSRGRAVCGLGRAEDRAVLRCVEPEARPHVRLGHPHGRAPFLAAAAGSSLSDENQRALGSARDRCLLFLPTLMPPCGAVWSQRDLWGLSRDVSKQIVADQLPWRVPCGRAWNVCMRLKK